MELRLSGWSTKAVAGYLGVHHAKVDYDPDGGRSGRLLRVEKPTLFETPFAPGQMRLFGLAEGLGEDGWLKALRLEDYALRRPRRPGMLQQALFPYGEAWG